MTYRADWGLGFPGASAEVADYEYRRRNGWRFTDDARGDYPTIRQFTVFLENRVGQLLDVVRRFEGSKVHIVAFSIHDSTECSFVRFLLSHPEQGREILERAGLALIETDLIGIELPEGPQPLLQICTALLQAEVNIVQAYPLMMRLTTARRWP